MSSTPPKEILVHFLPEDFKWMAKSKHWALSTAIGSGGPITRPTTYRYVLADASPWPHDKQETPVVSLPIPETGNARRASKECAGLASPWPPAKQCASSHCNCPDCHHPKPKRKRRSTK